MKKDKKKIKSVSQTLQASATLSDIILEMFISGTLPETRQINITELYLITVYDYKKLKNFIGNDYYIVEKNYIKVTADDKYLAEFSRNYLKRCILKLVIPSKFSKDDYDNRHEKYLIDKDYSQAELQFTYSVIDEILSVARLDNLPDNISTDDLYQFRLLYCNNFYYSARRVFNDILQNRLHAGDNIMSNLMEPFENCEAINLLNDSCKFDYFFDKDGILKCDLKTNRETLIKNFINIVLTNFNDINSQIALLQKLNAKYPILN